MAKYSISCPEDVMEAARIMLTDDGGARPGDSKVVQMVLADFLLRNHAVQAEAVQQHLIDNVGARFQYTLEDLVRGES